MSFAAAQEMGSSVFMGVLLFRRMEIMRQLVGEGRQDARQGVVSALGFEKLSKITDSNTNIWFYTVIERLEEASADKIAIHRPNPPGAFNIDRHSEREIILRPQPGAEGLDGGSNLGINAGIKSQPQAGAVFLCRSKVFYPVFNRPDVHGSYSRRREASPDASEQISEQHNSSIGSTNFQAKKRTAVHFDSA